MPEIECESCNGYGHFDENGDQSLDNRDRKCSDCRGTGSRPYAYSAECQPTVLATCGCPVAKSPFVTITRMDSGPLTIKVTDRRYGMETKERIEVRLEACAAVLTALTDALVCLATKESRS